VKSDNSYNSTVNTGISTVLSFIIASATFSGGTVTTVFTAAVCFTNIVKKLPAHFVDIWGICLLWTREESILEVIWNISGYFVIFIDSPGMKVKLGKPIM